MNPWCIRTTPHWTQNPTRFRTFTVNFFSHPPITTVVTSTPAIARDWVYTLRFNHSSALHDGSLVVGLGVQWRPTFSSSPPEAATLQLCVESECLIFQLYHAPAVPATLRKLLADDRITFVGVHNGLDRRLLEECQHELEVGPGMVDLAAEWGGNCSMERMAEELIGAEGVVKPRWIGMSNWEEFWLSNEQVEYACVDAYVSYLLAHALGFPQFDDDDYDENDEENDDEDEFEDGYYDEDGFYHYYDDEDDDEDGYYDEDGFYDEDDGFYHLYHDEVDVDDDENGDDDDGYYDEDGVYHYYDDEEDEDGFYDDDGFYHLYYDKEEDYCDEVDVDGFCIPYEWDYERGNSFIII